MNRLPRLLIPIVVGIAFCGEAYAATPPPTIAPKVGPNGPISYTQDLLKNGFSWSLNGVPDIDQVRATDPAAGKQGLSNDGKMWCLPTSGMDFLSYLADLGYSTGVASKDWLLPDNYNEMSADLEQLGAEMGTSPVNGTGGTGFVNAMTARLNAAGSVVGELTGMSYSLVTYGQDPNWQGPSAQQMALAGLDGALPAAVIGYYNNETDPDDPTKLVKRRVGGHMMAAVGATGLNNSPNATIRVRDPATLYVADTVQGPYATDSHNIVQAMYKFIWFDSNANEDKTGTWTVGKWDGSATTLWEGYFKAVPTTTWYSLGDTIKRLRPYPVIPTPDPGPLRTTFDVPGREPVKALALSGASQFPAYLVGGSSRVYSLDAVTGKSHKLAKVKGARSLTFGGPSQHLFVAGRRRLVAFDGITGRKLRSRRLRGSLAALAFDERAGLLVGVTGAGRRLLFFDDDLHRKGSRRLSGLAGTGTPLVAIGPKGGLLLARSAGFSIFSAKPASKLVSPAAANHRPAFKVRRKLHFRRRIRGLAIDDLGHILVARSGRLLVFNRKGKRVTRTRFKGKANAVLAITRSFSNFVPALLQPSIDFLPGPDPARPPLPDLAVNQVTVDRLRVRNIGNAAAGPFILRISDPRQPTRDVQISGLAAGAETQVDQRCGAGSATADVANAVRESNETNNTASLACPQ